MLSLSHLGFPLLCFLPASLLLLLWVSSSSHTQLRVGVASPDEERRGKGVGSWSWAMIDIYGGRLERRKEEELEKGLQKRKAKRDLSLSFLVASDGQGVWAKKNSSPFWIFFLVISLIFVFFFFFINPSVLYYKLFYFFLLIKYFLSLIKLSKNK